MVENSNKEIIEKLERLHFLLEEALECDEYVKSGCAEEYGGKIKESILTADNLGGVPSVFKKLPVFPIDSSEIPTAKQEYEKRKKIFTCISIPTVVFVLIFFLTHWGFFNTISTIGIIATIIYFFIFSQGKKTYKEKEKAFNDSVKKSEQSFAEFRKALNIYEEEKASGIIAAENFAKEYNVAYKKHEELLMEYDTSKRTAMETLIKNMEEAQTIDFVPEEYYDLVKPMISMLKSGRAENYKEALNMAIEEDRIAQAEAARQAEEARKIQIMQEQAAAEQRRAEEMERHNRQVELEQQRQNKLMLEEQRKQSQDLAKQQREAAREAQFNAEKARRDANKQAAATRMAGVSKCSNCMNNRRCPTHIKESGGGLNCGSYTPYGSR